MSAEKKEGYREYPARTTDPTSGEVGLEGEVDHERGVIWERGRAWKDDVP
jgi:hypothetical protein